MTGSNRRSNAGRKAQQPSKPKPKAQRVAMPKVRVQPNNPGLANSNANYRPMHNQVTRVTGSDYLGTVSVVGDSSTAASKLRKTFPVSPSAYPGTRLSQMAELWERYRFRKFSLRYVPSVPNTMSAQVLVYQDTDPKDDPTGITDADALIRQATSQTGSQQWNFNQPKRVDLASRADKELYYTGMSGSNERLYLQGKAYFVQVSDALDFNGTRLAAELSCGSLYVDWEVDFQTPQINPDAVKRAVAPTPRETFALYAEENLVAGTVRFTSPLPSTQMTGEYKAVVNSLEFSSTDATPVTLDMGITYGSSTVWSYDDTDAAAKSFRTRDTLVVTSSTQDLEFIVTSDKVGVAKLQVLFVPV
nr:MAG: putative coat protein [Eriocheir sinensis noda-like virus]